LNFSRNRGNGKSDFEKNERKKKGKEADMTTLFIRVPDRYFVFLGSLHSSLVLAWMDTGPDHLARYCER
jgi:hypothetical protein